MTAPAEGPSPDIDKGRLAEMLALVGPASEELLLRSLIGDLKTARARLLRAAARRDAVALRQQTHVLASLASTFGAIALNAAAQELQSLSRIDDLGPDPAAGPDPGPVFQLTDRLLAELSERLSGTAP